MMLMLRAANRLDTAFLTEMLRAAAFWRTDGLPGPRDDVLGSPELAHYIVGWPQAGDQGVVAEADEPVGAAWLRFFAVEDPSYGFIDATIPELSMGVVRQWRGQGIGGRLLEALSDAAHEAGVPAISLSVESDNYARRLYETSGFQTVFEANGSLTMRLDL